MSVPVGGRVIGVDFDNTIAGYDDLMYAIARERGLIGTVVSRNKRQIRDAIRALPDGETHWRRLQVTAYGARMHEARPLEGVKEFLAECRRRGVVTYIVSHKPEYANFGEPDVNLREAAMRWLDTHGFLGARGLGFDRASVFFESTRAEKVCRIRALGATHFIDDLEETFLESDFPQGVAQLLLGAPSEAARRAVPFATWRQIQDHLFGGPHPETLTSLVGRPVRSIDRCGAGGNGRVYRIRCEDGSLFAAKSYFQPTMDGLDRLEVEFNGLSFLWAHGERAIPRPVAADRAARLAVYEFVEGHRIDSREVSAADIEEVVRFTARLKALAGGTEATALRAAAEACGSFSALRDYIARRLERLEGVEADGVDDESLQRFLSADFTPAFALAVDRARTQTGVRGWTAEWPEAARTLSPSDMGFHNAVRRRDGSIVFLDFEYFGKDDAVKMLSDFLLHPAMDLAPSAKQRFMRGILDVFAADPSLPDRFALSYPLFALKWCLILLNEFVPAFLERREFAATDGLDRTQRRAQQLEKSRQLLARTMRELEGSSDWAVRA